VCWECPTCWQCKRKCPTVVVWPLICLSVFSVLAVFGDCCFMSLAIHLKSDSVLLGLQQWWAGGTAASVSMTLLHRIPLLLFQGRSLSQTMWRLFGWKSPSFHLEIVLGACVSKWTSGLGFNTPKITATKFYVRVQGRFWGKLGFGNAICGLHAWSYMTACFIQPSIISPFDIHPDFLPDVYVRDTFVIGVL